MKPSQSERAAGKPAKRTQRGASTSPRTSAQTKERRLRASLQEQPPEVQQDRAKRSYEALLDAAERLFGRDGYDEVGTPQIAAEAGVSVGTLYRYFDDKKAVYLAIVRRYLLRAYHQTIDPLTPERFAGKARHETLEETVRILFEYVEQQPRLNRVFLEMSLRDADVAKLRLDFEAAAVQRLAQLVAMICPRDVIADPEATAWVLHAAALQCAAALSGPARPAQLPAARVRKALTEVIERSLFPGR